MDLVLFIISKVKTTQQNYIILYFSHFPTPRVTRVDINRNTDLALNAFVASWLRFAVSESPGWFYQTTRGRMGRKRKWPPGSEFIAESVEAKHPIWKDTFPNLSKHPTKSLVRTIKMELQESEACNSSYLFTRKTFTMRNGFIHLEALEFKALKFFCGDFSRTSNSHETKSSYEERKQILEALVWWVHVWLIQSFVTDLKGKYQISSLRKIQSVGRKTSSKLTQLVRI